MKRTAACVLLAVVIVVLCFCPFSVARTTQEPKKAAPAPQKPAQAPEKAVASAGPFIAAVGGNTLNVRSANVVNNYQGGPSLLDAVTARRYAAEVTAAIRAEKRKP